MRTSTPAAPSLPIELRTYLIRAFAGISELNSTNHVVTSNEPESQLGNGGTTVRDHPNRGIGITLRRKVGAEAFQICSSTKCDVPRAISIQSQDRQGPALVAGRRNTNRRESPKPILMSHQPRSRAPTLAPHPSRKEHAFEHCEQSEALAQGSPLAHERGDDPRPDRHPPQLSRGGAPRSRRWCHLAQAYCPPLRV